jgi:oligopeptidase B
MTYLVDNHQFNTRTLRYSYNSLTTPYSIYEYDLDLKDNILLKESEVVGGYDKNLYQSERIEVTSRDGVKIPVSIVYKKDKNDQKAIHFLYGYGSYGYSLDPSFLSVRLSLLIEALYMP